MQGRTFKALVLGLAAAAMLAPGALAGKPTTERVNIDESFADEFLSEACGFAITTFVKGHITFKRYDRDRGPVEITNLSVRFTAVAGDRTYRFNDAGADMLRIERDGTAVLSIVGQVPFEFNGILRINPDTGEVLKEPQASTHDDVERVCERLSA